ncbi:transcription factor bHLH120-like [Solanum verrucosum]|uniref:transcription factor bHLH120-like n=1 Tax=Solanum verrucosum TaxID=315347 RepID=UPI0020D0BD71|nr:transcription factor bHLH120-like [Solanum verrucosum]
MDDSEFDFGQLDQLFNFLSSTPPPLLLPPTTLQINQDSSFSLQKQNSNLVFTSTHHVPKKKSIVTNHVSKKKPILITNINIIDDQVQDPPKEKEMVVEKKVMRRDVERQRRCDMAKLYQRLRLLIPSKYLMGKRSISDHLEEIVDYVKDLKKDIEDLESKREKLKEMKNINCSSQLAPNSSSMKLNDDDEDKIIVKSCNEGVEISIKGGLSISKVLKVLMKEELIVISCVSSTINQRLIHIIQTKVNTRGDIDLALLRSKLMGLF